MPAETRNCEELISEMLIPIIGKRMQAAKNPVSMLADNSGISH